MTVEEIKKVAAPVCKEFGVKRLDLFGSTARSVQASGSDIDLLVDFEDPSTNPARRFFGLLHRLEDELGCEIDLLTVSSLKNPYFRRQALNEKVTLYEG